MPVERAVEEFVALFDTPIELIIAEKNGHIKANEKYITRLTDFAQSESEGYKDFRPAVQSL